MKFDYSKLRGRIRERFETQKHFADALEVAVNTLSFKLNNKVSWTQREILISCRLLNIEEIEMASYFFKEKVQ